MGSSFADNDDGRKNDYYAALYYYLQAEFAINMRMKTMDYFGDEKVKAAIIAAMEKVKKKINYKPASVVQIASLNSLFETELVNSRKLNFLIKKQDNFSYKFIITAQHGRKMFLTVPEIGMCGLFSKITLLYKTDEEIERSLLDKSFEIDEISYFGLLSNHEILLHCNGDFILKNQIKQDKYPVFYISQKTKYWDFIIIYIIIPKKVDQHLTNKFSPQNINFFH